MGVLGGVVALGLAAVGVELAMTLSPAGLPRANEIAVGPATIAFTLAASLFAGLLFGLFPLVRIARMDPGSALGQGGPGSGIGRARHHARNTLVVAQVALALVLLTGSGLMIRTFRALRQVEPGFSAAHEVLTFRLTIPESEGMSELEMAATFETIVRGLEAIPGVVAVGGATSLPMDATGRTQDPLLVEDVPWVGDDVPPLQRFKWVTGDYFATLQNPLVAGREIDWRDIRDRAAVAVVTENLAAVQWGSARAALGERIALVSSTTAEENAWHTIVGVVRDVRDDGVHALPPPIVFWPMVMHRSPEDLLVPTSMAFAVRTTGTAAAGLLPQVRDAVATVHPALPLGQVQTLDQVLRRSMGRTSFVTVMLVIAASVALSLGLVGIYSVVNYVARLRTREIGLRIALGADGKRVRRLVLGHGARLTLYGIGVGLVAALGITRVMSSLIYGVEPNDPMTLSVVVCLLVALTLTATYLPARRASRIDPMEALRAD